MLDNKLVRDNPKIIKDSLKKRGLKQELVDEWLELDTRLRHLKSGNDELRHKKNELSEEINKCKKAKDEAGAKRAINQIGLIPEKIRKLDNDILEAEQKINDIAFNIPNLVDKKVPEGKSAEDNKVIRKYGAIKETNAKSHVELLENLGLLDLKASAKLAGEGFYVLKGELAILQRALINFFLDYHKKKKRTECNVPMLANEKTAFGTAQLPKFDADMYKTREGFYLTPTSEMQLANLHQDSVLSEEELPKRYCAYTPCFRTEAGKHGTETRGLFRLHQFDKVEMISITLPEESEKELKIMLDDAEKLLKMLKIPYRIILLCSGDMGFAVSITYDLEVYSPFLKKYLEASSVSNCKDFQARRMNAKFLRKKTNQREYVHTLNGSGLALPRLIISLIENNQQPDGSIKIPKVLQKYTGFDLIKAKINKKKK